MDQITTLNFLALPELEKVAIIQEHLLELPVGCLGWITTGAILERMQRLGFNIQYNALAGTVQVTIFSFAGEGDAVVMVARGNCVIRETSGALPSSHDAVAIAALMSVGVIDPEDKLANY